MTLYGGGRVSHQGGRAWRPAAEGQQEVLGGHHHRGLLAWWHRPGGGIAPREGTRLGTGQRRLKQQPGPAPSPHRSAFDPIIQDRVPRPCLQTCSPPRSLPSSCTCGAPPRPPPLQACSPRLLPPPRPSLICLFPSARPSLSTDCRPCARAERVARSFRQHFGGVMRSAAMPKSASSFWRYLAELR